MAFDGVTSQIVRTHNFGVCTPPIRNGEAEMCYKPKVHGRSAHCQIELFHIPSCITVIMNVLSE
jgi:hypothetical protein